MNRVRQLSIVGIWSLIFLAGSWAAENYQRKVRRHEVGQVQALLISKMGAEWLSEAKMAARIDIRQIFLQKSPQNKILSVQVALKSSEVFEETYRDQLIQYLNYRGRSQTGLLYQFSF